MMKAQTASGAQMKQFLEKNPGWGLKNQKLHREYLFKDFKDAFAFMEKIAGIAESMNHHPEWFNVYNRLVVDLTTHDTQSITNLDIALAETMENIFGQN